MRNRLKYKEMYGNTERAHSKGELLKGISAFVKSLRSTVAVVSSVLMWRKTLNFNAVNVFAWPLTLCIALLSGPRLCLGG